MNNSLRSEALKHFDNGETQEEIVDAILALIESKMPEKRPTDIKGKVGGIGYMPEYEVSPHNAELNAAFNQAITEVKSILKGGTDE